MSIAVLFTSAALAAALSYALTPATAVLAHRLGAIDLPGPRKMHPLPVPRLGGVAVVAGIMISLGALSLWREPGRPAVPPDLLLALGAGLLPIFLVSCWDDVRSVRPLVKLASQIAGAAIVVSAGLHLDDTVQLFGRTIPIGALAIPLSIVWIVGITNAFNLVDGLDGLSAGLGLISAASLGIVAVLTPNPEIAVPAFVVLGALAGFIPYNLHPARLFLGDCGANAAGFCLGCLALMAGSSLPAGLAVLVPIVVLGVPVAETVLSIVRRALRAAERRTSPAIFQADAEHIHHRLVGMGITYRRAVLILYSAGLAAAGVGIASLFVTAGNAGLLLATLIGASFIGISRLGYEELAVLRRGVILKIYDTAVIKSGHFRVFVDIGFVILAFYGAVVLKYDDWNLRAYRALFLDALAILLPVTVAAFWAFRLYARSWRFAAINDVISANGAVATASALGFVLVRLFADPNISATLFGTYTLLLMLCVSAGRSSFRVLAYLTVAHRAQGRRVVLYGAGARGVLALDQIRRSHGLGFVPVGFIDDDRGKRRRRVGGLPILGDVSEIRRIIRDHRLEGVILASDKITPEHVDVAVRACAADDLALLRFSVALYAVRCDLSVETARSSPHKSMRLPSKIGATLALLGLACAAPAPAAAQPAETLIRLEDQITITVEGQPEVSGQYAVGPDGSVLLPLIGPVKAVGLADRALADVLERRLDDYFRRPRVHVAVQRPERVFVFGAVGRPGTYDITGTGMTLLELLARAEYSGVSEVLVVRTLGAIGPVLPEQASPSDVIRVNMRDLEKALQAGDLSGDLQLEAGDTVFVPEVDPNAIHVTGEVRNPGAYSVPDGTTIRQVLALAGGLTEDGSLRGLRILRIEGGEQRRHNPDLDDPIEPRDTVLVPEAFFLPAIPLPPGIIGANRHEERPRGRIRLGRAITVAPTFSVTQFGFTTNALNSPEEEGRKAAFVAELTPQLQTVLDLPRLRLELNNSVGLAYYRGLAGERAVNPLHGVSVRVGVARRLALGMSYRTGSLKERISVEFDPRIRREEEYLGATVELGPWRRVRFDVSAEKLDRQFPEEARTLTERRDQVRARAELAFSPRSSAFVLARATRHDFPSFSVKDADSTEFGLGTIFERRALLEGAAYVGYLRYTPLDPTAPDANILSTEVILSRTWREHLQLGVRLGRSVSSTFRARFAYAVVHNYGGWIHMTLPGPLDFVAEAFRERWSYHPFRAAAVSGQLRAESEDTVRYTSQLGLRAGASRIALEVSYGQRIGNPALSVLPRSYTGWRTSLLFDVSYRFLRIRQDEGSSIRGRDGFRNY